MGKILFLMIICFVTGCLKEDMRVSTIKVVKNAEPQANKIQNPELTWDIPQNWTLQQPSSNMVLANFRVITQNSENSHPARVSLVLLNGDGGGLVADVNMWSTQLGLSSLSEKEAQKITKKEKGEMGVFQWVKIENAKTKFSVLAAIIPFDKRTLFVKLMGPSDIVNQQADIFLKFCSSIKKGKS